MACFFPHTDFKTLQISLSLNSSSYVYILQLWKAFSVYWLNSFIPQMADPLLQGCQNHPSSRLDLYHRALHRLQPNVAQGVVTVNRSPTSSAQPPNSQPLYHPTGHKSDTPALLFCCNLQFFLEDWRTGASFQCTKSSFKRKTWYDLPLQDTIGILLCCHVKFCPFILESCPNL